jgi:[ribosomal protein S5]-alanine N-acetyltransferase
VIAMQLPDEMLTERLWLRRPALSDAEQIFACYSNDPEVCRFLAWKPHQSVADTIAYLQRMLAEEEEKNHGYLIFARESGELLGSIGGGVMGVDGVRVQFGYCLARDAWGQGFATEATRPFVHAVLSDPSIWRIQALCDVENAVSARVLEKCGLKFEGTLRRYMILPNLGDTPRDVHCYSSVRNI